MYFSSLASALLLCATQVVAYTQVDDSTATAYDDSYDAYTTASVDTVTSVIKQYVTVPCDEANSTSTQLPITPYTPAAAYQTTTPSTTSCSSTTFSTAVPVIHHGGTGLPVPYSNSSSPVAPPTPSTQLPTNNTAPSSYTSAPVGQQSATTPSGPSYKSPTPSSSPTASSSAYVQGSTGQAARSGANMLALGICVLALVL